MPDATDQLGTAAAIDLDRHTIRPHPTSRSPTSIAVACDAAITGCVPSTCQSSARASRRCCSCARAWGSPAYGPCGSRPAPRHLLRSSRWEQSVKAKAGRPVCGLNPSLRQARRSSDTSPPRAAAARTVSRRLPPVVGGRPGSGRPGRSREGAGAARPPNKRAAGRSAPAR